MYGGIGAACLALAAVSMPNHLWAKPNIKEEVKVANSNPEKLLGAVNLGENFSKLPKPLKPLYGSPKNPDFSKCPEGLDFFYHPQKMCTYVANDKLTYSIDNKGEIYAISMKIDKKGEWPKPLPLGIKTNFYHDKLHDYFYSIGIKPWRYTVFHDLNYIRDACFFAKEAETKLVCFIYDAAEDHEKKKIVEMRIFTLIRANEDY